MLIKIDNWLFDKIFQPISDWFVDRTGRGTLWLASTCAYLFVAGTIALTILFESTIFDKFLNALVCLSVLYVCRIYDRREQAWQKRNALTKNPLRALPLTFLVRMVGILVTIFLFSDLFRANNDMNERIFRLITQLAFLCSFYFAACETTPPAPPKKGPEARLIRTSQ